MIPYLFLPQSRWAIRALAVALALLAVAGAYAVGNYRGYRSGYDHAGAKAQAQIVAAEARAASLETALNIKTEDAAQLRRAVEGARAQADQAQAALARVRETQARITAVQAAMKSRPAKAGEVVDNATSSAAVRLCNDLFKLR